MALLWELVIALDPYLNLLQLFIVLFCGICALFSRPRNRKQAAAKTDSEVRDRTVARNSLLLPPKPQRFPLFGLWEGPGTGERGLETGPQTSPTHCCEPFSLQLLSASWGTC